MWLLLIGIVSALLLQQIHLERYSVLSVPFITFSYFRILKFPSGKHISSPIYVVLLTQLLMQSNYQFSAQKPFVSLEDQTAGGNIFDIPGPSVFGTMALPTGFKSSVPFHGFEFQSSEACPKNFIIFDQTDYRSQIMYHPAMASKFPYPDLNNNPTCFQDGMERKIADNENTEVSSYPKEDSDDINALLSLEEEEHEEYDEDEVSTARTDANYGSSSPESYSNYDCQSKKSRTSSFRKSSGSSTSNCSERKRRKLKKMVEALKGIVPGASRMNTVTILEEAVRYLKSLKMEVQKLGVENLKTFA